MFFDMNLARVKFVQKSRKFVKKFSFSALIQTIFVNI